MNRIAIPGSVIPAGRISLSLSTRLMVFLRFSGPKYPARQSPLGKRVSAVIFLSEKSEAPAEGTYGGGALVFHGPWTGPELRVAAGARPGSLVAFRAETTHEVTPVTHGVRYTIATWFRSADA